MSVLILKKFLSVEEQQEIINTAFAIEPGFYRPTTKWGQPMSILINCLGLHWSAKDYKYHKNRPDADGKDCAAIPEFFQNIAQRALSNYEIEKKPYDICIMNWYDVGTGKLGLHQDCSESKETLATGHPVVSISIGDSAIFLLGGTGRKDPVERIVLGTSSFLVERRDWRIMAS